MTNPIASSAAILAGAALVILTLLDVALTALHVQSESPLSTRLNRLVWWSLERLTRVAPDAARSEILGWGLPIMLSSTLVAWAIAYIVGFALLVLPLIHDPLSFNTSLPAPEVEDTLFYSGATFFNLASGDIVPLGPLSRALTVIEGGTGLLTISLAVTYLLRVYPVLSRKVALADTLNLVTGGRADGVVAAERYVLCGWSGALMEECQRVNSELIYLAHVHRLYPVLYYVRSRDVHESFVRVLALAQGLIATLRYTLEPDAYAGLYKDPRLLQLEEGLLDTLHLLVRSSHLNVPEDGEPDLVSRDFDGLRSELIEAGLRVVPADAEHRSAYSCFLRATEPHILAYAHNLGYSADLVWRAYDRRERRTALTEHEADSRARRACKEPQG